MSDTVHASYLMQTEWLSVRQVAAELSLDYTRVLNWTKRKDDPLPARLVDGNRKQARVFRPELNDWIMRNSDLCSEVA